MPDQNPFQMSHIYLRLADVIFGVIIAASFIEFKDDLIPFQFTFKTMMLLVAYLTVVLSWIGYHKAVEDKPHKDWTRFSIDLVLLFFYFYLIFTESILEFLGVTAIIFFLYLLWVVKRHFEHPPKSNNEKTIDRYKIIRTLIVFGVSLAMYNIYINFSADILLGVFFDVQLFDWIMLLAVLVLNVIYRIVLPIIENRRKIITT